MQRGACEISKNFIDFHSRNSRHEHTLNQKKVFVDEMRSRIKVTLSNLESTQQNLVRGGGRTLYNCANLNKLKSIPNPTSTK